MAALNLLCFCISFVSHLGILLYFYSVIFFVDPHCVTKIEWMPIKGSYLFWSILY